MSPKWHSFGSIRPSINAMASEPSSYGYCLRRLCFGLPASFYFLRLRLGVRFASPCLGRSQRNILGGVGEQCVVSALSPMPLYPQKNAYRCPFQVGLRIPLEPAPNSLRRSYRLIPPQPFFFCAVTVLVVVLRRV